MNFDIYIKCPKCEKSALLDDKLFCSYPTKKYNNDPSVNTLPQFNGFYIKENYPSLVKWKPKQHYENPEKSYICKCSSCMYTGLITVELPHDLYSQTEYRGTKLWAYNYDHVNAMLEYIKDDNRSNKRAYNLHKLPKVFQSKKNRNQVIKLIEKNLK
jgi:hypothetical protein